jgi:hypothetical protein
VVSNAYFPLKRPRTRRGVCSALCGPSYTSRCANLTRLRLSAHVGSDEGTIDQLARVGPGPSLVAWIEKLSESVGYLHQKLEGVVGKDTSDP